ncbi:hypothetical protein PVAND_014324 [Polypedilum vanderplanki]|uniref:Reverse transcriptase domain-containing protein n=1 Tax=Polypedilum vanderplanki TaxID=319348 RepID=A0A9J6CSE3_POLVA|nr:hypothetical protein PVAND_014324 [Polypedilum vanderplanki]
MADGINKENGFQQRSTLTPRSPTHSQTPSKRQRSQGDETDLKENNSLSFDDMKRYVDTLSEQIHANHRKDIEESNKIITTTMVNNIKEIQEQMSANNKIINDSITNTSIMLSNSLKVLTDQLLQLTTKIELIETNVADLNNRVEAVEKLKVQNGSIKERKIMMNMIKQNKIENTMEIVGLSQTVLNSERNPKQLAIDTIRSFQIPIDEQDITKASKKEIEFTNSLGRKHKETRILVIFNEMKKKVEVMKMKSKIKDNNNIFFNISLTPTNAFIMRKAKQLTKGRNLKVFFKDNGVKVDRAPPPTSSSNTNKYHTSFANYKDNQAYGGFTILHFNTRGLNKEQKFEKLKCMILQLIHKPDLLVFSETKLKPRFPVNIYNINGYKKFSECRKSNKKDGAGGGLLVFIRKDINILSNETLSIGDNIKSSIQKIKLKISLQNETFTIICYYRPPDQNNSKIFLMDVEKEMEDSNGKTIFLGDLNINLNASTSLTKKYTDVLNCYDFDITNSFVTRNDSNSIIDHTVINFITESTIINHTIKVRPELSDHNMVITSFSNIKIVRKHSYKKFYKTNFTRLQSTFEDLASSSQFDEIRNPNDIANELIEITFDSIYEATECKTIKLIVETFNNYFIDNVNNLTNKLPNVEHCDIPLKNSTLRSCVILPPTENEIISIIKLLKNSSCGLDNIKVFHIKCIATTIAPILKHLIDRMLDTGIYPDDFKIATITPINKSGDFKNIADYRPISVLSTCNKVIEKFLHERLWNYVESNNLISDRQFGFRKKCNTELAALELINDVRSQLDIKKKVALVLLDLRKAFDVVDHNLLIDTLERNGFRGNILKLLANYLMNRQQLVKYDSILSGRRNISSGVIQGSILGPLLFILYISDVANLPLKGKIYMYADDIVIAFSLHMKEDPTDAIKHDMMLIKNFLQNKKLILNTDKSNFMVIHSPHQKITLQDSVLLDNNEILKRVDCANYLGLFIDHHLKWDVHINNLTSKLSSAAGALWKLKYRLPLHIKKIIYQSLIESNLYYMSSIWGSASNTIIKNIQIIQNRALRNVFNLDRRENRVNMYTHLVSDCLPIRAINYVCTATIIYNILNKKVHSNISFNSQLSGSRSLRNKDVLRTSNIKTHNGSKSINFLGVHIYNNIDKEIKNLKFSHAFKLALKCSIRNEGFIKLCFSNDYLSTFS